MQNQNTILRSTALILTGAAAIVVCYFSYKHFSAADIPQKADAKLHRSNAVRRRRRRWRHGFTPQEFDRDPLERALEDLEDEESRREAGEPNIERWGTYNNDRYVSNEMLDAQGSNFGLLPSRFGYIQQTITQAHGLSEELSSRLARHIKVIFLQSFLRTQFPEGYMINGDVSELQTAFAPYIEPRVVREVVDAHDQGLRLFEQHMSLSTPADRSPNEPSDSTMPSVQQLAQALSNDTQDRYNGSGRQRWEDEGQGQEQGQGQNNVLDLLYRIGEEQATRNGYQHRGVECNGCGMQPIRGIRYHCANCWDYDLCETCEAQQIHHKTHVFYKIRIPAPTRGQIKLVQPKWYPGNPNACPESIPGALRETLLRTTDLGRQDIDALYEQFKCIAGKSLPEDIDGIGMAIDRPSFDRYFTSTTADRSPAPNLIYDRIFAFYDQDGDDLIKFHEFVRGMAELAHNTSREARIKRLFEAFDLNGDGYVDRRDFLLLLRAHYQQNKELAHEMIYARDDALLTEEEIHEVIQGNNPISAAFGGSNFPSHRSRHGAGKHASDYGELVLDDDSDHDIVQESSNMAGDRADAIARQTCEHGALLKAHKARQNADTIDDPVVTHFQGLTTPTFLNSADILNMPASAEAEADRIVQEDGVWPNDLIAEADVLQALGRNVPFAEITDVKDRLLVLTAQRHRLWNDLDAKNINAGKVAVEERWRRREFYLDEEEGFTAPVGYYESDDSDIDSSTKDNEQGLAKPASELLSLRSRSSSKVRFDDSAIDNETDAKSDISSRSTPANERWGGFELSQPARDIGVELIYEAVQEAFNDLLNHFFKDKEDKAMAARKSRHARKYHAEEMRKYADALSSEAKEKEDALLQADKEHTETLLKLFRGERGNNTDSKPAHVTVETGTAKAERTTGSAYVQPSSPTTTPAEESIPDPTLPQNRPNSPSHAAFVPITSDHRADISPFLPEWHQHELTDREAKERGGHGRLNILEFKRKLRDDQGSNNDIDVGAENMEEEYWDAKADLARFSFLSSWIEMASF